MTLLAMFPAQDDLNLIHYDQDLPSNQAQAFHEIVHQTVWHEAQVIAGEFVPALAARLAKSQSQGGALAGKVLAFPGPDQHWDILR